MLSNLKKDFMQKKYYLLMLLSYNSWVLPVSLDQRLSENNQSIQDLRAKIDSNDLAAIYSECSETCQDCRE
jgi:hypothetical protein